MQSQHFIDGHWTDDGQWAESFDPSNGEVIGRFAEGGEAQARDAVAAAAAAFANPHWAQNPRLRQQLLLDWAVELKTRHEPLAQLLSRENGKALTQSRGEVAGAISEVIYYAGLARHNPGHILEVAPGEFSSMLREPAGVAGLIIPWNAPAVLLIRAVAPAIAAGCTVVIKPAPQTALFNAAILEPLLNLPGLPAGAVNLFAETGHAGASFMVASPEVDVLSFTGSTATGQRIMQDAAATMKKLSLELGGEILLPGVRGRGYRSDCAEARRSGDDYFRTAMHRCAPDSGACQPFRRDAKGPQGSAGRDQDRTGRRSCDSDGPAD